MEGNEEAFFRNLDKVINLRKPYSMVRYLEFGIAEGGTFAPACRFLADKMGEIFCAVGIDLPNGWSLSRDKILENLYQHKIESTWGNGHPSKGVHVIFGDAKSIMQQHQLFYDFVLIDACHGKNCFKTDFMAVSRWINVGGIVAIHDTSEGCQGIHPQKHCGDTIQVRQGLRELGLLDGEIGGWRMLEETQGQDGGHGMAFFQYMGF